MDVCKTRIISRDRQSPADDNAAIVSVASASETVPATTVVAGDPLPDVDEGALGSGLESQYDGSLLLEETKTKPLSDMVTVRALNATESIHPVEETLLPPSKGTRNDNIFVEFASILRDEGPQSLFLGFQQRLIYVGLANGIRLAAYGTSRMDLMMKSLDSI